MIPRLLDPPNDQRKPRLLDLFCGAGGSAVGYARAGFEVVGVDHRPMPRYPFEFKEADALAVLRNVAEQGFFVTASGALVQPDAIHASPPCQAHSNLTPNRERHENLIPSTRALLRATGLPYVIENVAWARAELIEPVVICGVALGLNVVRHRLFESSVALMVPPCVHARGGGLRNEYVMFGDGRRSAWPDREPLKNGETAFREACEATWMTTREARQAIPPAYTELIGCQLLDHLRRRNAA